MIPLRDLQRSLTKPHVNRVLIIVNVAVFVLMFLSDVGVIQNSFIAGIGQNYALYPYEVVRG